MDDDPRIPASASPGGWPALEVEVPRECEEDLVGRAAAWATGAEATPGSDGPSCRVRLFPGAWLRAEEAEDRLRALLREVGLGEAAGRVRRLVVRDERWVERYQESLRPFPLGERFRVYPAGRGERRAGRVPIRLVPGRAFGTGEHETTRLCAEALERHVTAGASWLDLGCGTAILAIVAHRLGARVRAVDVDPEAVEVARAVLAENGLAGEVGLACGSLPDRKLGRFDGIVANISGSYLGGSAREIAGHLEPGGLVLASGFSRSDAAGIAASFAVAGLGEVERREAGEWTLLVARRREGRD